MRHHFMRVFAYAVLALATVSAGAENAGAAERPAKERGTVNEGKDTGLLFGGCGGVYFLAEPGELEVEVVKRDRNLRDSDTELRAILVGPDRQVLQEAAIPDDGQPKGSGLGPPQWASLSARVERKGVYALNITVSNDRYGQEMVWGFRTNCPKYLIETARGHKDERHQEPLVFASLGKPADVCFLPRQGKFDIAVSGMPGDIRELPVYDAKGQPVATLPVQGGKAAGTIEADQHRDAVPWRLHFASAQATLNLDGLTRWEKDDPYPDLCCWSPDPKSWFPFLENRWLLTPYSRTVYGRPGEEVRVAFRVCTNTDRKQPVRLSLEFPNGEWSARLSTEQESVSRSEAAEVAVTCTVPPEGETRVCHVRVSPADTPGFSTYSTVFVKAGEPPAARPLQMPIMLTPYRHENELFGYLPDYPTGSQMYFDLKNRPCVVTDGGIAALRDGRWRTTALRGAVQSAAAVFQGASVGLSLSKIAFDRDGDLYALASAAGRAALLHSTDAGQTFTAYEIPGPRGGFDLEQFSGHNGPASPPPFVRFVRTSRENTPGLRWRSENNLELFVPKKVDGRIDVGEPILLSKLCLGLSAHSGIPSSVVSRGAKVHVAWGEATDPQDKTVPGVPTFVVTYDTQTRQLGKPALIGYGPPANDVHNSPSITMDSQGYLHVLVGTHGRPFQYAKSLTPNDAGGGWTEPVQAGEGLNQTYIGFVCGNDDTLYTVFRLWRSGEPFPHSTHATLAYQRKRPGQPWEPPKILVVAPFSEYSIFYHRLTIDQRGRLFLSKDYWSTHWFYRNDHVGDRRALLMSPDGGDTWKLVDGRDWG